MRLSPSTLLTTMAPTGDADRHLPLLLAALELALERTLRIQVWCGASASSWHCTCVVTSIFQSEVPSPLTCTPCLGIYRIQHIKA